MEVAIGKKIAGKGVNQISIWREIIISVCVFIAYFSFSKVVSLSGQTFKLQSKQKNGNEETDQVAVIKSIPLSYTNLELTHAVENAGSREIIIEQCIACVFFPQNTLESLQKRCSGPQTGGRNSATDVFISLLFLE